MKKLMLFLALTVAVFAQRTAPVVHHSTTTRFGETHVVAPSTRIVVSPPVVHERAVVRHEWRGGRLGRYYGWGYPGYYGLGFDVDFWPNGWYYNPSYVVTLESPCKKEKLKDTAGLKHEVLVCRQADGSFAVVADADQLPVK